jgi:alkylation response protein AidB-like acyl-CoA dehydrogenase
MSDAAATDENIRLIRDSAAAVTAPRGDLKRIRALRFTKPGFDRATFETMREMGWTALLVPEADGGAGLGMAEFCALAEELGAALLPEPLLGAATAARIHPALAADSRIVLPAWQERANSLATGGVTLRDGRLDGRKVFVPMAAGADAFLVVTEAGCALVPADAPGLTVSVETTQDGGHFGTLTFDRAPAEPVAADATAALEEATLAVAATLLGVMERAFALTLDYLKTRQQFGEPIGSFQALQHRCVDLQIQIALTRASLEAAARTLDTVTAAAAAAPRAAAVSRAKARAAHAAMLVTREAIQLHGGIGYTDEYDVGLYLRRAMTLANLHGSAALHRARYATLVPEHDDE